MFFDEITPWEQLFYACGIIWIARHIQQYQVEILEHVQTIRFRGFYNTVDYRAGRSFCLRGMEKRRFAAYGIALCFPFRGVV